MGLKFKEAKDFALMIIDFNANYREELKKSYNKHIMQAIKDDIILYIAMFVFSIILGVLLIFNHVTNNELIFALLIILAMILAGLLIYYKNMRILMKIKSKHEILKKYLIYKDVIDLDKVLKLNDLYINKDNQVKRLYEFLYFDSINLKDIEYLNMNDYDNLKYVIKNQHQLEILQQKAKHTELTLKQLQSLLKNYVIIVEDNYKKYNMDKMQSIKISDSVQIYKTIEDKYKDFD